MTTTAVVWIVVGLISTAAVAAVLIALVRQLKLLGRTLTRFQEEVQPLADEIAAGTDRASTRASSLSPPGRS